MSMIKLYVPNTISAPHGQLNPGLCCWPGLELLRSPWVKEGGAYQTLKASVLASRQLSYSPSGSELDVGASGSVVGLIVTYQRKKSLRIPYELAKEHGNIYNIIGAAGLKIIKICLY